MPTPIAFELSSVARASLMSVFGSMPGAENSGSGTRKCSEPQSSDGSDAAVENDFPAIGCLAPVLALDYRPVPQRRLV